ncbi:hypothetical protein RvY_07773 [Ramazzottius varieornatus]|uniref:Uncharacterized protein n=1 Tax=Ramazzottius varieornatus TaxID=947166 RepID=A0A1D1V613_RAMVA|nr:hypothetical protein RvY_07773 [Ramazzottius varieornatus]
MSLGVRCLTKRLLLVLCCISMGIVLSAAKQSNTAPTGLPSSTSSASSADQAAECYIEVRQTKLMPGRCLPVGRLSSMPNLCQSLDREFISVQNECANVRAAKGEHTAT